MGGFKASCQSLWRLFNGELSQMTMSTIAGIALAIGHHWFYSSLDKTEPPDQTYLSLGASGGLTKQQVNLAVGAAFAFLVKTFLGIASSIAQEQLTWRFIISHPSRIGFIDGLFHSKDELFSILNLKLWIKSPWPMTFAAIYWLLPIASFFPPATLNIEAMPDPITTTTRVPIVDFTSTNFAYVPKFRADTYKYSGAQPEVQRLVTAAMSGGQILPITPPHLNASWGVEFYGPVVKCVPVSSRDKQFIGESLNNIKKSLPGLGSQIEDKEHYVHLVWAPGDDNNTILPRSDSKFRTDPIGPRIHDAQVSLFAAAFNRLDYPQDYTRSANITQCTLYNASYAVNFNFINGIPDIKAVPRQPYHEFRYLDTLNGSEPLAATYPNGTIMRSPNNNHTIYNVTLVERQSYQAVMEAFGLGLVGSITYTAVGQRFVGGAGQRYLLRAKELAFMNRFGGGSGVGTGLAFNDRPDLWDGASVMMDTSLNKTMGELIEDMFINATVSLMSSQLLQPNYTSRYAPAAIPVTETPYRNGYVYSAVLLWASYGTAIFLTLVSILAGFISAVRSDGTYNSNFSTILRATSGAALSKELRYEDVDGKSPVPGYVEDIVVTFPNEKPRSFENFGMRMGTSKRDRGSSGDDMGSTRSMTIR